MNDNALNLCEMCGEPREPQQKKYCKACAEIRLREQLAASKIRQKEKRRQQREAERLAALLPKPKVEAPPTIAEVVAYAKEHGLHRHYGLAVQMMEAEKAAKQKATSNHEEEVENNGID